MPNRCKTCAHPKSLEINQAILGKRSFRSIAIEYGFCESSLRQHGKNHLKPMIAKVEAEQRAQVKAKVVELSEEVLYPLIDKVQMLQNRILADIKKARTAKARVPLYRELRGALQEQAKICGEYTQDRENSDRLEKTIQAITAYLEAHPDADREKVINTFAIGRNVSPEKIAENLGMIG